MSTFLLVGDVHATAEELDDCNKLIDYICGIGDEYKYDYVVFLGDQTHNHAILNVHVLNFWKESFKRLQNHFKSGVICLIGNHDLPGNIGSNQINSMSTLDGWCTLVSDFLEIEDILFVGYQHNKQKFIDIVNKSNCTNVICHQTFQGATYENGFYAQDGIDLNNFENKEFISGHIHTPQQFGNVCYVGAPRWRTSSDSNVTSRYLNAFDSNIKDIVTVHPTDMIVRRIISITLTPDDNSHQVYRILGYKPGDIVYSNLIGPASWIESKKDYFGSLNAIVKTFPTDSKPVRVRESEGIDKALSKYVDSVTTKTPKEDLKKMIEERLWK